MKRALITGVTGQDGSYLSELLLAKGYEVHGTARRASTPNTSRIVHLLPNPRFHLHTMDVTGPASIDRVMLESEPDEIYNLAAQSHVGMSFELPADTAQATGMGTLHVLDAYRRCAKHARFYQASSSEMFGDQPAPQSERTPFAPVSPYAVAKVFAHQMAVAYRNAYGLHISCGIMFNHESPRRGEQFVTRKICMGLARIKAGLQDTLSLGNMDARRDWGYAPEYVEAMWLMLQRETPCDLVIGTGTSVTVGEFLHCCMTVAGLSGDVIKGNIALVRPSEVPHLRADTRGAVLALHWKAKIYVAALARLMMEAEMAAIG